MKTEIIVKHGIKSKIAKEIGCHRVSVVNSLKGLVYSKQSDHIREIALNKFGGVELKQEEIK